MPGVPTEVLNDDIKELKADIHGVAVGLAELRAEFRTAIAVAKWVVTALVTLAAVTATGIISGVWWASGISSDVRSLQGQVSEIRSDVQNLKGQVSEIRADVRTLQGQVSEVRALVIKDREPVPAKSIGSLPSPERP